MDSFNPNKRGMPAASKGGACWRFFSNYCCTLPPPPLYRPARLVGEKTPTDLSSSFGTVSIQNSIKRGALEFAVFCYFGIEKEVVLKFL